MLVACISNICFGLSTINHFHTFPFPGNISLIHDVPSQAVQTVKLSQDSLNVKCDTHIKSCWFKVKSQDLWATRDHEVGMSLEIQVSIATAHNGVMWLTSHPTAFDSMLCRHQSQLNGLEMHQKLQM